MRINLHTAAMAAFVLFPSVSSVQASDAYIDQMKVDGTILACSSLSSLDTFIKVGFELGVVNQDCRVIPVSSLSGEPEFLGWQFLSFEPSGEFDWSGEFEAWAEDSPLVLKFGESSFLPTRGYSFQVGGCSLVGVWPYPIDPHFFDQELMGNNVIVQTGVSGLGCETSLPPTDTEERTIIAVVQ